MPLPIHLALDIVNDDLHAVRARPASDLDALGAPLLLRVPAGLALPLWRSAEGAGVGARAAADGAAAELQPLRIAAADLRAKEELLRDALELGAALLLHDPQPGGEAAGHDLVQRARNELLAERRASACL